MHHVEGHCKFFLRGGGFQKESMKFNWNVQNWGGVCVWSRGGAGVQPSCCFGTNKVVVVLRGGFR